MKQSVLVAIVLAVVFAGGVALYMWRVIAAVDRGDLSKGFMVHVTDGEVADYQSVDQRFDLLNHGTRDQLKQYMRERHLRVKPGAYEIFEHASLGEVRRTVGFEPTQ